MANDAEETNELFMKLFETLPTIDYSKDPAGHDFRYAQLIGMVQGLFSMKWLRCIQLGGLNISSNETAGNFIDFRGRMCIYLQKGSFKALIFHMHHAGDPAGIEGYGSSALLDIMKKKEAVRDEEQRCPLRENMGIEDLRKVLSYFPRIVLTP